MSLLVLINQHAGPLPVSATFNSPTDAQSVLMVSGSVWSGHTDVMIGISVVLDGKPIGVAQIFSNTSSVHRAVVPTFIPVTLPQGAHTLAIVPLNSNTVTDLNDLFDAVLFF
jgi:hypothetical protein